MTRRKARAVCDELLEGCRVSVSGLLLLTEDAERIRRAGGEHTWYAHRRATAKCFPTSFLMSSLMLFRAQVPRRASDTVVEADRPREADDTVTWGETGSRSASVIKGFLADSRSPRLVAFEFLGQPCGC